MTSCNNDASSRGSGSIETRIRGLLADTMGRRGTKRPAIDDKIIDPHTGFDSIALMEFVLLLEDSFGIKIPDKDLRSDIFQSIHTIGEYVRRKAESPPATHSMGPADDHAGFEQPEGDEP